MNKAQAEYLERFCKSKGVNEETALTYVIVKDVIESLKDKE